MSLSFLKEGRKKTFFTVAFFVAVFLGFSAPQQMTAYAANVILPAGSDFIRVLNDAVSYGWVTEKEFTVRPDGSVLIDQVRYKEIFDKNQSTWNRLWGAGSALLNPERTMRAAWATAKGTAVTPDSGACITATPPFVHISNCFAQLLYFLLWVLSFLVSVIGYAFDFIFQVTVRDFKAQVDSISVIETGWAVVRDLCNIFFIFILLWLSLSTILGLNEHGVKHGLSRLIVAAILINFSLLFTKVVIDVPNMISVTIYNQVTGGGLLETTTGKAAGLGSALFNIVSPEKVATAMQKEEGATASTNAQSFAQGSPVTTFVMMVILYVTVLFVFLAVCIIFIKRFVILLFLMIFSPLAFLGMAIPVHSLQHEAQHKFWNTLFKEAFYAPIFLLCFYVALMTGSAMYGAATSVTATIVAFTVTIIMVIASLIIAEEMGVSGAGGAMTAFKGMSQGTASALNTNTVGRFASTWINSKGTGHFMGQMGDTFRDVAGGRGKSAFARSFVGRYLAQGVVSAADKAGKPFDEKSEVSRKWMEDAIGNRHGDHEFVASIFAQASLGGATSEMRKAADNQFHHMSLEQKANMYEYLKDMAKRKVGDDILDAHGHKTGEKVTQKDINGAEAAKKRYFEENGHGRLESDEVAELPRKRAEGLTYHDSKLRSVVEAGDANQVKKFFDESTEGQALSAIKSLGGAADKFKGDEGQALRQALTSGIKKFRGESFLSAIAKDNILEQSVKESVAAAGFQQMMAYKLSEAMTAKESAMNDTAIQKKFVELISDNDNMKEDLAKYKAGTIDIKALVGKYHDIRSGDETTANYVMGSNGKRSQIKSKEIAEATDAVAKMIAKHVPPKKGGGDEGGD
jgi:hypothetical protein